jgi:hypothetical protein
MPQEGYTDGGECAPNKQLKESFNEAVAAEKSRNLALAFNAYKFAREESGCEGPNPSSKAAQEGWKRTGQNLAKEAEAKGNFYANGSYTEVTRSSGLRLFQWNGVGAFQWYSEIGESADADRVMFRFAQSKPKDQSTFGIALGHFFQEGQSGVVNHSETFRELEKQAKSNPGDQQLQRTVGYLGELEKIAFKNIDEALVQEDKAYGKYNKREMVAGQNPIEESLQHLSVARDWYNLFGDPKANKVAERAGKRGDAMMQDERPKSFSYAKQYYDLGSLSETIKKLTEQANRLGDAAAKKDEYAAAVEYYEIGHSETGENEDKINEMHSRLEKESEKKEQAKQKVLKDMTKDEKKQKEFKKGQEDLEKELGF